MKTLMGKYCIQMSSYWSQSHNMVWYNLLDDLIELYKNKETLKLELLILMSFSQANILIF